MYITLSLLFALFVSDNLSQSFSFFSSSSSLSLTNSLVYSLAFPSNQELMMIRIRYIRYEFSSNTGRTPRWKVLISEFVRT